MKSAAISISQVSLAPAALAAGIALCLFVWAPPAHAASLTQDQLSSVQSLLQSYGVSADKIQKVSTVLSDGDVAMPPSAASGAAPCAAPGRSLMRGMRSGDVKLLQQRLSDEGYLASSSASGFFGAGTEDALKHWQADHGLVATGTPETTGWGAVGKKTIEALGHCDTPRGRQGGDRMGQPMMGSTTPGRIPQPPPNLRNIDQGGAAAMFQFASDYSGAFNHNMAAVATVPYNLVVGSLSDFLYAIGVGQ
jgi:peptidoglycan hydrolase-like protein with peptidoglycan-binding domain